MTRGKENSYSINSGETVMVTRTKILPVKQEGTKLGAI